MGWAEQVPSIPVTSGPVAETETGQGLCVLLFSEMKSGMGPRGGQSKRALNDTQTKTRGLP